MKPKILYIFVRKTELKLIRNLLLLFLLPCYLFGNEEYNSSFQIIDLTEKAITDESKIILDTGWEFYWSELITPNNFKNYKPSAIVSLKSWTNFKIPNKEKLSSFGYATYRLKFTLPKDKPITSLYIPKIFSSSKIWVNGEFIVENGKVGKLKSTTIHREYTHIIPLKKDETNFELVIQVANFYHKNGGINQPVLLSTDKHFQDLKYRKVISYMLFIGCLSFIGFFFLIFYLLYWNKDQAVLYFAILCISLTYLMASEKYAPLTYLFESINLILIVKLEYISLFIAGAAASLFFNDIFLEFIHSLYLKIVIGVFLLFTLAVVLLPGPFFTELLLPFFMVLMLDIGYCCFVIIKTIFNKKEASFLLLISLWLVALIFSFHIFFFLNKNEVALIYVNFGYVFVYLLLSMLLMIRFSDSFKELELSKNLAIQQRVEIQTKSEELLKVNDVLEENLRLLEGYNSKLDDFNHIVSHDLKSPLISIYSLVSFIEDDLKDTLDTGTKNHLNLLKGVVSKMEGLISGLLQYATAAKGDRVKEIFTLNDLINGIKSIVDYQNNSVITIEKDLELYANRVELEHVFQNLISNAIKYNDKEKAIINISATELSKEYLFSVSDNGPGIAKEYHEKIFKIFSKLSFNEDAKSSGVGLAIVKKLIDENKGIISVASKEAEGLKISFTWKV